MPMSVSSSHARPQGNGASQFATWTGPIRGSRGSGCRARRLQSLTTCLECCGANAGFGGSSGGRPQQRGAPPAGRYQDAARDAAKPWPTRRGSIAPQALRQPRSNALGCGLAVARDLGLIGRLCARHAGGRERLGGFQAAILQAGPLTRLRVRKGGARRFLRGS
jgi:hypothetical protein